MSFGENRREDAVSMAPLKRPRHSRSEPYYRLELLQCNMAGAVAQNV
jgi:hypothetical protein